MSPQQVERKVIELIHRDPFIPFVVELADGQMVEIQHPRLAINGGGAGFIGLTEVWLISGSTVCDRSESIMPWRFHDVRPIRISYCERSAGVVPSAHF